MNNHFHGNTTNTKSATGHGLEPGSPTFHPQNVHRYDMNTDGLGSYQLPF